MRKNADAIEGGQKIFDAILGMVFQPLQYANAKYNVEMAHLYQGKDRNYMWEAQILHAIVEPMSVVGSVLILTGIPILQAIGVALVIIGNSRLRNRDLFT